MPFLPGDTDLDQLSRIFQTLGTPTEKDWPGIQDLPDFVSFNKFPAIPLHDIFSAAGDDLLDLLYKLFRYFPPERITASKALQHKYFSNKPAPTPCELLPNVPSALSSLSHPDEDNNGISGSMAFKRKMENNDIGPLAKKLIF